MEPPRGPQISPDGRWSWDGTKWVPVEPARQPSASRRRLPAWLIAVVVLVALVLVSGISLAAIAFGSILLGKSTGNQIAVTCDQPMLRPGGPLNVPASACGTRLSHVVAALSCDNAGGQSAFKLVGFSSSGTEDDAAVSDIAQGGHCSMRVPAGYSGALISHAALTNPVAVVDFDSVSGSATLLVGMRCTRTFGNPPCVFVRLQTNEGYQCLEDRVAGQAGQVLASGSYANQQFPAPALQTAAPNRLVVMLNGGSLVAYLNTRLVCGVAVRAQGTDAPVVLLVEASTDTSIELTGFVVGEAT